MALPNDQLSSVAGLVGGIALFIVCYMLFTGREFKKWVVGCALLFTLISLTIRTIQVIFFTSS